MLKTVGLNLGILIWICSIFIGMKILYDYSKTPGPEGHSSSEWPYSSRLAKPSARPVLIMTVHPKCPCSQASIEELAKILTKVGNRIQAHVLMLPLGTSPDALADAKNNYVWIRGSETPNLQMHIDYEAREAKGFGALVSGQVLLFSSKGKLIFQGGITQSRGHQGDSAGHAAIVQYIEQRKIQITKSPVFGCHLFEQATIEHHTNGGSHAEHPGIQ